MKSESARKSELVKVSRAFGDYARRIEDQFTVGMPDIIYGIKDGPTCLIEAKLIESGSFGPTPRQKIELERWHNPRQGRISLLLGFDDDGYFYLHDVVDRTRAVDCMISYDNEPFHFFIRRYLR